jgi:hypothetical protein
MEARRIKSRTPWKILFIILPGPPIKETKHDKKV